jgi:hypothetical protein
MIWMSHSQLKNLPFLASIVLCLFPFVLVPREQVSAQATAPVLLWKTDLAPLGAVGVSVDRHKREGAVWKYIKAVQFAKSGELIAHFVRREPSSSLSHREESLPSDCYHLVAVFFDAFQGTRIGMMDWPTRPHFGFRVCSLGDGRFLVLTANSLSLYSSDREKFREYLLPSPPPPKENKPHWVYWDMEVSPNGQTVLLNSVGNYDSERILRRLRWEKWGAASLSTATNSPGP